MNSINRNLFNINLRSILRRELAKIRFIGIKKDSEARFHLEIRKLQMSLLVSHSTYRTLVYIFKYFSLIEQ
jgi:hypothetical protein